MILLLGKGKARPWNYGKNTGWGGCCLIYFQNGGKWWQMVPKVSQMHVEGFITPRVWKLVAGRVCGFVQDLLEDVFIDLLRGIM